MCFSKPKPDPRIAEEQAKARAEAEAAKSAALAAKEAQRKKLLEQEKEAAASTAASTEATAKSDRQGELQQTVSGQLTNTGLLTRSKRARRRGRGSLFTSSGGGIGYYNENM